MQNTDRDSRKSTTSKKEDDQVKVEIEKDIMPQPWTFKVELHSLANSTAESLEVLYAVEDSKFQRADSLNSKVLDARVLRLEISFKKYQQYESDLSLI